MNEYTKRGFRVLALAFKDLKPEEIVQGRNELECNLNFAGFLVCQTPLKRDTTKSISALKASDHELKVISGDHVINVAVSAKECGIISG